MRRFWNQIKHGRCGPCHWAGPPLEKLKRHFRYPVTCRSGKDVEIDHVDNPGFLGEGIEGVGPSAEAFVTAGGGG